MQLFWNMDHANRFHSFVCVHSSNIHSALKSVSLFWFSFVWLVCLFHCFWTERQTSFGIQSINCDFFTSSQLKIEYQPMIILSFDSNLWEYGASFIHSHFLLCENYDEIGNSSRINHNNQGILCMCNATLGRNVGVWNADQNCWCAWIFLQQINPKQWSRVRKRNGELNMLQMRFVNAMQRRWRRLHHHHHHHHHIHHPIFQLKEIKMLNTRQFCWHVLLCVPFWIQ